MLHRLLCFSPAIHSSYPFIYLSNSFILSFNPSFTFVRPIHPWFRSFALPSIHSFSLGRLFLRIHFPLMHACMHASIQPSILPFIHPGVRPSVIARKTFPSRFLVVTWRSSPIFIISVSVLVSCLIKIQASVIRRPSLGCISLNHSSQVIV